MYLAKIKQVRLNRHQIGKIVADIISSLEDLHTRDALVVRLCGLVRGVSRVTQCLRKISGNIYRHRRRHLNGI